MGKSDGFQWDRLICGDVGLRTKTEVAIRAAFKAGWPNGKQAAILVPTTILADSMQNLQATQ